MKTTLYPSLNDVKRMARRGNLVPVYRDVVADLETPVSMYLKLARGEKYAYLLESVEGGERWGRYSFISWAPKKIFQVRDGRYAVTAPGRRPAWKETSDPLGELKRLMDSYLPVESEGLPRFWGGAVGYASYDTVRSIERLPGKQRDLLDLPESFFMLTDRLVVFDHLNHTVRIVVCLDIADASEAEKAYRGAEEEIDSIVARMRRPLKVTERTAAPGRKAVRSNMSRARYCGAVDRVKEYIRAGDVVQTVVSQRFSRETEVEPFSIYRSLRRINPSPYMYYLQLGEFEIIGSSPEILVRREGDLVETRPIAGTRRRGRTDEEEAGLAEELLADPKERAEHIMLVDLGRNDLARVSEPASVSVPSLMEIERYSHVMHIVSSVTGRLRPGADSFDTLRACFPAGTVSGAPKVRAMEIIDELEPDRRGPYAGAVGYFSYSGAMDMAITIRTIVLKDGVAYGQAGAGIVADSVPESEYTETKNKAAVLFAAIDRAEEGLG